MCLKQNVILRSRLWRLKVGETMQGYWNPMGTQFEVLWHLLVTECVSMNSFDYYQDFLAKIYPIKQYRFRCKACNYCLLTSMESIEYVRRRFFTQSWLERVHFMYFQVAAARTYSIVPVIEGTRNVYAWACLVKCIDVNQTWVLIGKWSLTWFVLNCNISMLILLLALHRYIRHWKHFSSAQICRW